VSRISPHKSALSAPYTHPVRGSLPLYLEPRNLFVKYMAWDGLISLKEPFPLPLTPYRCSIKKHSYLYCGGKGRYDTLPLQSPREEQGWKERIET